MQFRALFFTLICTIPLLAGSPTLYDDLKASSTQPVQSSFAQVPDSNLTPLNDLFSDEIDRYWISTSLKQQFEELYGDEGEDYIPEYVNVNEELPYRYRKLIEDTVYLQVVMVTAVAALSLMPESFTGWKEEEVEDVPLEKRWRQRVSEKPIWDEDDWDINYIGHTVSGAIYYTMARGDGMSIFESAAYTTLMSTFFWEYGYEAFAEIPSIQDLIVTPLFGSILGEGMYILEGKLDKNGGMLWGSRALGNISYFVLNPMGNFANGISDILKRYNSELSVRMTWQTYPRTDDISQFRLSDPASSPVRFQDRDYGFLITLE
ncbi:MAG: DUF3943 domain-containing protein [Sulfurimonadaceae bacterium]